MKVPVTPWSRLTNSHILFSLSGGMDVYLMDKITQKSIKVAGNSPWFSGHFPDNPILPGVAQLEMIVKLISEATGSPLKLTGMSRVKFRKIVQPGDLLDIQVASGTKKDQYTFRIVGDNQDVCSGNIFLSQ